MGITSTGIGSGLDVETIVTKLVALEKRPLTALQTKEASIQSKISTFSQLKSLVSTFADTASKLTRDSGYNSMSAASTNGAAVTATVSGIASATSFGVDVQQLARTQSVGSASAAKDTVFTTGKLTIQLGSWNTTGSTGSDTMAFAAGTAAAVDITLDGTDNSLSGIASKINGANAGVTATVLTDASGTQRLLMRSTATGQAAGFRVQATDTGSGGTSLAGLAFDIEGQTAASVAAATTTQLGLDAKATINGVPVTSATNTFANTIPGLSLQVSQVTTATAGITVTADTATTKKNIQAFVDAYNAVNDLLSSSVKYDADTKTKGLLQGDSTAVGLQNMLRSMVGAVSAGSGKYATLSDIGIAVQRGGGLTVDASKLDKALSTSDNAAELKKMLAASGQASGNGVAVQFKALTTSLLSFEGTFNTKTDSLGAEDKRNLSDQDRITARAAAVEKRLRAQYSALDAQMASISSLNTYVSQQITNWNKSTS